LPDNIEFTIKEDTLAKMLSLKKEMGFDEKGWDEWLEFVLNTISFEKKNISELEKIMEKVHFEKSYDEWVKNFSFNLNHIWQESSARDLDPSSNPNYKKEEHSAIVIGAGPSIPKHNHLEILAKSNYQGSIICTDRSLKPALKAGITPDKFEKYYVTSIDGIEKIKDFYTDPIISNYGHKINGIFSTVVHPLTVQNAREAGIKIHWLHALFDYNEGKKSFNQISALMVRAKNHLKGLPAIQTGGNVGTSSWFIAWQILKCAIVGLIGINHSWDENDSWEIITANFNAAKEIDRSDPLFNKLFPKIYNPEFKSYCILDPIFQFYSNALKEFITRSPLWVTTVNATEGGCIFGERITCATFTEFLTKYKI
jgi:hypothetical protein